MKKLIGKVLAEGETTGHAHRVEVDVFDIGEGLREFSGPTIVTHEEHNAFTIPMGDMVSGIVQEYDEFEQEARNVRD
jgi:hypothetical protein